MPNRPETLAPDHAFDGTIEHRGMLLPRRRSTPAAARSFVAETLTRWGHTGRLDDIRLCTSELATNAVLHGAPAGRLVLVRVLLHDALLRIDVQDSGDGTPNKQRVPDTADHGRGLLLVSAIADDWGVAARQGPGKCVWAVFHHCAADPTTRRDIP
ncbi:ATP-binding protein [Streptomyces sp. TS71-3]|uniref:ATP-binding protein n=1 Tax=Streptomyces sp. TS71-3 TaxID=2733862 RepID=UPI001B2D0B18|nr:ATP-binding protein [Streptomyces sp. TS71-3]GHJ36901.1 hypothetical protein Sm713_25100 [Streptomyces sp. TS71-3]